MTWSLLVHTSAQAPTNTSAAVTGNIDCTGADILIAAVSQLNHFTASMADSQSNTWSKIGEYTVGGANVGRIVLWKSEAPTVTNSQNFTGNSSNCVIGCNNAIAVAAFSGAKSGGSAFDQIDGNSSVGAVTTLNAGASGITPTENGELLISAIQPWVSTGGRTIDNSFTIIEDLDFIPSQALGVTLAWKVQITAALINPQWSFSSTANPSSVIASFKVQPAAASVKAQIFAVT